MAETKGNSTTITLDLPVRVPEFTLQISGTGVQGVRVDGRPLTRAMSRAAFGNETFYREGDTTFAAFTPTARQATVDVQT